MSETWFKKPVYMITGVKIARGFHVTAEYPKGNGGELSGGVDVTALGVPLQVGPEVKVIRSKKQNFSFKDGTDCVFAYRLIKIKSKKAEMFKEDDHNKGVLLS